MINNCVIMPECLCYILLKKKKKKDGEEQWNRILHKIKSQYTKIFNITCGIFNLKQKSWKTTKTKPSVNSVVCSAQKPPYFTKGWRDYANLVISKALNCLIINVVHVKT